MLALWGDVPYPTEYSYDSYGRMSTLNTYRGTSADFTQSTWPSSPGTADTTTWTYQESTGLLTAKTYADAKSVSYTYTADGKLATRTWSRLDGSNPLVTSYSYDTAADLTGIAYSDSTPAVGFTYNRLGQETSVSDALGNRIFSYNNHLQLSTEGIDGLYDRTITHGYDSIGRNNALSLDSGYSLSYSHDGYGRHNGLAMNNQTITYGFTANSNLIGSITRTNGINTAISYESNRNAITQIQHANTSNLATYGFTNDTLGRRTAMAKSGSAFSQSDTIDYGYNDRSEVVSAESQNISSYDYGFSFDPMGNRITSRIEAVTRGYTKNNLNQYTAITNPTGSPTYDFDGNMTSMPLGATQWSLTWDAENRLISAVKNEDTKLEFAYDYMSRRIFKKVYSWDSDHWSLTNYNLFIYNGYRQIERISVNGENQTVLQRFAWSLDDQLRLIADISSSITYSVHHDANRNVSELTAPDGSLVAHYEYAPFGALTVSTGSYANSNPFRFSSEYFDSETGLVYFCRRYYSPELGRWLSRDPIEEFGGWNLYGMGNDFLNRCDYRGLWSGSDHNTFTASGFDDVTAGGNYDPDALGGIRGIIEDANVKTDRDHFWDSEYHFTDDAGAYAKKLNDLSDEFNGSLNANNGNPSYEDCKKALETLGNLSHAWQDYYAHAIDKNSNGSIYIENGVTLATVGSVSGNPEKPGDNMKPVSFSLWLFGAEHGISEPGDRAPDRINRRWQAAEFTAVKYKKLLMDQWWPKCYCLYCKEWKNGK